MIVIIQTQQRVPQQRAAAQVEWAAGLLPCKALRLLLAFGLRDRFYIYDRQALPGHRVDNLDRLPVNFDKGRSQDFVTPSYLVKGFF
jgi:hypothetical protein